MAGPPCAGKSSYVDERRAADDVVIDHDVIARELGSPDEWLHEEPYRSEAQAAVWSRLESASGTVWLIRSMPDRGARAELVEDLGAELVVLDPTEAVCLARARVDGRPSGTRKAIRLWYWRDRVSGAES